MQTLGHGLPYWIEHDPVIVCQKVTMDYGNGKGIFDLNLTVRPKEIYGLVGPNGAGKTTTIRTLLDIIYQQQGTIKIWGQTKHHNPKLRKHIGYVPGELILPKQQTPQQYLDNLNKIYKDCDKTWQQHLILTLNIDMGTPIGKLSKGNRQKVALLQALAHQPKLLILDEPTDGLDPFLRKQAYRLLKELQNQGATIVVSSHVISELEEICTRLGVMRDGELVAEHDMQALRSQAKHYITAYHDEPLTDLTLLKIPGVEQCQTQPNKTQLTCTDNLVAILQTLTQLPIYDIKVTTQSVEQQIMQYYGAGWVDE